MKYKFARPKLAYYKQHQDIWDYKYYLVRTTDDYVFHSGKEPKVSPHWYSDTETHPENFEFCDYKQYLKETDY